MRLKGKGTHEEREKGEGEKRKKKKKERKGKEKKERGGWCARTRHGELAKPDLYYNCQTYGATDTRLTSLPINKFRILTYVECNLVSNLKPAFKWFYYFIIIGFWTWPTYNGLDPSPSHI